MKKTLIISLAVLFGLFLLVNVFVLIQTSVPSAEASVCPGEYGYYIEVQYGDGHWEFYCIEDPNYDECCAGGY